MYRLFFLSFFVWASLLSSTRQGFGALITPDEVSQLVQAGNTRVLEAKYSEWETAKFAFMDQIADTAEVARKTELEKRAYAIANFWNQADSSGLSPLHWAVFSAVMRSNSGFPDNEMTLFLLQHHADPKIHFPLEIKRIESSLNLKSFQSIAECSADTLWHVLDSLKDGNVFSVYIQTKFINRMTLDLFLQLPLDHLNDSSYEGLPPLLHAVGRDLDGLALALVHAGVNVNITSLRGETPLRMVFTRPIRPFARAGSFAEINDACHRAGITLRPPKDCSESSQLVNALLRAGANPFFQKEGSSEANAYQVAFYFGGPQFVSWLFAQIASHSPTHIQEMALTASAQLKERKQAAHEAVTAFLSAFPEESVEPRRKPLREITRNRLPAPGAKRGSSSDESESDKIAPVTRLRVFSADVKEKIRRPKFDVSEGSGLWVRVTRRADRRRVRSEDGNIDAKTLYGERPFTIFSRALGKKIQIQLTGFRRHVDQRHREVGNHDIHEPEAVALLQSSSDVIRKNSAEHQRYVFFGLRSDATVAKVVISKRSREDVFQVLTAYQTDYAPRAMDELGSELQAEGIEVR